MRAFASDGTPSGDAVLVNEVVTGRQIRPRAARTGDGSLAVVWQDYSGNRAIKGRLFHSDATPRTGEFQVNTSPGYYLDKPRVDGNSGDRFVVVWENGNYVGASVNFNVMAQVLDGTGAKVGGELQVNQNTDLYQWKPDVAFTSESEFLVVWSDETYLPNPSILSRKYELSFFTDGFESGDMEAWSSTVP